MSATSYNLVVIDLQFNPNGKKEQNGYKYIDLGLDSYNEKG